MDGWNLSRTMSGMAENDDERSRSADDRNEESEHADLSAFADMVARDLAAVGLSNVPVFASDFDDADWDSEEPDPGCVHPWYRLDFVSDEPGLGCSRCGQAWLFDEDDDAKEGILVVWQAARHEFERLARRHDALADVVEGLSGLRHCQSCDTWAAPDTFATFGRFAACPHHVGATLATLEDPSQVFVEASTWLVDAGFIASVEPMSQWIVETNVLDFPPLGDAFGRPDDAVPDTVIRIQSSVAEKLGVPQNTTVGAVTEAIAEKLSLDMPSTRPSWTFMLGVIACVNQAAQTGTPVHTASALKSVTPVHGTHRAVIVMDLCRSDMPDEGTFTGDMADDLVQSLGARAFDLLV